MRRRNKSRSLHRKCIECGTPFTAKKVDSRFCSPACSRKFCNYPCDACAIRLGASRTSKIQLYHNSKCRNDFFNGLAKKK